MLINSQKLKEKIIKDDFKKITSKFKKTDVLKGYFRKGVLSHSILVMTSQVDNLSFKLQKMYNKLEIINISKLYKRKPNQAESR